MKEIFRPRVRLLGVVMAAASVGCVCTLTGFAGSLWWMFDITSHFRIQYAFGLTLMAGLFGLARKPVATGVLLTFAVLNWALVIPQCWFGREHETSAGKTLRVMQMNVHTENTRHDLVATYIREKKPDLIALEEVNAEWLTDLAELRTSYPYSVIQPQSDNFGIALFSRLPLQGEQIVELGHAGVPSVVAEIELNGKTITVL